MTKIRSQLRSFTAVVLTGAILGGYGCMTVKPVRVSAVALTMQDVAQAAARQTDPTVVREGTPAYLMLLDGLLEAYPENRDLLVAGCKAYASYASLFLGDDQPRPAEAVYDKARRYGFHALDHRGDFARAAAGDLQDFRQFLQKYDRSDVPALFCTASAWIGWIGSNPTRVEALGDLPVLEATLQRLIELDERYYYGGPRLLMGVYLAATAGALGGDMTPSREQFDRAFALGSGDSLGARVLYAQYYAAGIKDRELFVKTLKDVLAAPPDTIPEFTLSNIVAKEKARKLLDRREEIFGNAP